MSVRYAETTPHSRRGRVEREVLTFSRQALDPRLFAALHITATGVPPGIARSGDKRDRDEPESRPEEGEEMGEDEEMEQSEKMEEEEAARRTAQMRLLEQADKEFELARPLLSDPNRAEVEVARGVIRRLWQLAQNSLTPSTQRDRLLSFARKLQRLVNRLRPDAGAEPTPSELGLGPQTDDEDEESGDQESGDQESGDEENDYRGGGYGQVSISERDSGDESDSGDEAAVSADWPSSSQLASQLANDLDDIQEDEFAEAPLPQEESGAGAATQLQDMELDADSSREKRLRMLRDEVVAALRDVPVGGRVSSSLHALAERLQRDLLPYYGASEPARRMLAALATLLMLPVDEEEREEAAAAAATTERGRGRAAAKRGKDDDARIVGRATTLSSGGQPEHSFLLYAPRDRKPYEWLTKRGMLNDTRLATVLANHPGPKGDDPRGNGWAIAIVDMRGTPSTRQYRVRWTTEPQVPVKYAQPDEWYLRRQLTLGAQAMADAFERGDDDGDEEDDVADDQRDGQSGIVAPSGPTLRWDPSTGKPKLSLRRAVAVHARELGEHTVQALREWTLTRIWALRTRTPPPPGSASAPSVAELDTLGEDLFTIDAKALTATFRRVFQQRQRDRAAEEEAEEEEGEEEDEEEEDEEKALAAWKAERERELRDEAVARWAATQRTYAAELAALQAQLAVLRTVEAAGGNPADVALDATDGAASEEAVMLAQWQSAGGDWPAQLSWPPLRLPKIRDFLSTPGRSAAAKGWLSLQRDVHSAATLTQRRGGVYGSAYGPTWPARAGPVETPPDHVLPQRWYEGGTKLLIEAGDPGQLPAVALCRMGENSAKSDSSLALFSAAGEVGSAGQDVYAPKNVSEAKRAMLAKTTAWCFALYPLISDRKRGIGVGSYARNVGVEWYARAWENGPFKQLVRAPATSFERRVQLLALAMPRWQVGNPLVFAPDLLDQDMEQMLLDRMRGTDGLSKLVDAALQAAVAAAPR